LIIKYTQTEHSHDGYCSDPGEEYEKLNGQKIYHLGMNNLKNPRKNYTRRKFIL
jgi:hypothetical protein